jgi:MarR family
VSADMFGMALRAYVRKVQRLGESSTERGRTLWEAVYDYLSKHELVTREEVIQRFHRDEEALVRGVLHDLTESGLVFATGTSASSAYRVATENELGRMRQFTQARVDELLWVIIYREGPLSHSALLKLAGASSAQVTEAIDRLLEAGRIRREGDPSSPRYRASDFVIPLGAGSGWEAAILDHYHALVRTICQKLRATPESAPADTVGGSTYSLAVWPGHPLREEVMGCLRRFRENLGELRGRVDAHNDRNGVPADFEMVVVYGGQSVTKEESDDGNESG